MDLNVPNNVASECILKNSRHTEGAEEENNHYTSQALNPPGTSLFWWWILQLQALEATHMPRVTFQQRTPYIY